MGKKEIIDKDRYKTILQKAQRKYKLKKKSEGVYWKHRGDRTGQTRRYYETRKLALKAHRFIERAVKRGWIKRPKTCSICGINKGNRSIHAHHDDYTKPAEVVWACWLCHNNLHNEEVV